MKTIRDLNILMLLLGLCSCSIIRPQQNYANNKSYSNIPQNNNRLYKIPSINKERLRKGSPSIALMPGQMQQGRGLRVHPKVAPYNGFAPVQPLSMVAGNNK